MKARFRDMPGRVMTSVHRGLWGPLPENSLAAIRAASDWDVVEIDLRVDGAGAAYVMHDDTLERTTGHPSATSGADPDVLAGLRLREGAGGNTPLTDQHIPTLADAASAIVGTGAVFDYDVKRAEDVRQVAEELARLGIADTGTLKIDVTGSDDIRTLKALEADFGVMVMAKVGIRDTADLDVIQTLADADQAAVEVSYASLPLLAQACAIGGDAMRLGVYTLDGVHCCGMSDGRAVNTPDAVWGALITAGVGQIMTDRAAELGRYLDTRG